MRKKVIFLGTRIETLELLKILFDEVKIITTKKSSFKFKEFKYQVIDKKNKEKLFKKLIKSKEEILISAGFPYLIPENVIKKFKFALNCHPGKLPKYKGYYSINNAIDNKEKYLYSTIHFLNKKFDSGKKITEIKIDTKNIKPDVLKKIIFSTIEPLALFKAIRKINLI